MSETKYVVTSSELEKVCNMLKNSGLVIGSVNTDYDKTNKVATLLDEKNRVKTRVEVWAIKSAFVVFIGADVENGYSIASNANLQLRKWRYSSDIEQKYFATASQLETFVNQYKEYLSTETETAQSTATATKQSKKQSTKRQSKKQSTKKAEQSA